MAAASFDKRRIVIIAGVAQANAAQKLLPFDNYLTGVITLGTHLTE
jgi:hypothetical protein